MKSRAERAAAAALNRATVIRGGDLVLLCFSEEIGTDDFDVMVDMLKATAPGITWGMVEGVVGVLVQPGGGTPQPGPCTREHQCAKDEPCNGFPRSNIIGRTPGP